MTNPNLSFSQVGGTNIYMEAYVLVVVFWEDLDSWGSFSSRPLVCCKFERKLMFYYIFGVRSKRDPFQKIDLGLKFLDMTSILQGICSRIKILGVL